MTKVIGIGGCGNNILEFLKKQNFQSAKSFYEFVSVHSENECDNIKFDASDTIFTIAGLGGNTGGKLTKKISEKVIDNKLKIKNLLLLPFNAETNHKKANIDLEELLKINQNIEVYANNDLSDDSTLKMIDIMKLADEKIFESIKRKNQVTWQNFIVEQQSQDIHFKALVSFWSKDFKITLIEPKYKMIEASHMPLFAPSRFDIKEVSKEISSIQDIEEIAQNALSQYIQSEVQ